MARVRALERRCIRARKLGNVRAIVLGRYSSRRRRRRRRLCAGGRGGEAINQYPAARSGVRVGVVVRLYLYKTARRENRIRTEPRAVWGRRGRCRRRWPGFRPSEEYIHVCGVCTYVYTTVAKQNNAAHCRKSSKYLRSFSRAATPSPSYLYFIHTYIPVRARAHIENASCVL